MQSSKDNSGETAVVDAQNILHINRTLFYNVAICMPYNQTNYEHKKPVLQ